MADAPVPAPSGARVPGVKKALDVVVVTWTRSPGGGVNTWLVTGKSPSKMPE